MDIDRDFSIEQDELNNGYSSNRNTSLRSDSEERVAYGHWSMYTKKIKDNPQTAEEEIEIVLKKLQNQIEYSANLSIALGVEDYQTYVIDWVTEYQRNHGVSTAEEIGFYSMRLLEDMNRYRAQFGYDVSIPIQYFKSFNTVLAVYKNNPWMTKDDIHNLAEEVLLKNKYYAKAKCKDRPYSHFMGIVDKALFKDDVMFQRYKDMYNSSELFENTLKVVGNVLPGVYTEQAVKEIVRQLLFDKDPLSQKNSNYYNVKFSLLKSENPKEFLKGKKLEKFLCSCIDTSDSVKTLELEEIAKAVWSIGMNASSQDIKELVVSKEKSMLHRKIYNYLSRCYTKKSFVEFVKKHNIVAPAKEVDYSTRIGICVKDKHGNLEIVSAYRNCNDIDVIVKKEDGYFLVSHAKWDKVFAGRDMLMHNSYSKIGPRKIKTVKINDIPVVDLFETEIKRQEALDQYNEQEDMEM